MGTFNNEQLEAPDKKLKRTKKPRGGGYMEEGQDLIANRITGLEKVNGPQNYNEYLEQFPKLKEYFSEYKGKLTASIKDAADKAKGTKIEKNMRKIAENLDAHFEEIMFNIMQAIDLKDDPVLIDRITQNRDAPTIVIGKLHDDTGGETSMNSQGDAIITISPDQKNLNGTYEGLRATLIHEFAHAFIEKRDRYAYNRNSFLNEGITEHLSSQVLGEKPRIYNQGVVLTKALFTFDKRATLRWYVGGSDNEFRDSLITALEKKYPPNVAAELALSVVNFKGDELDLTVNKAKQDKSQLVMSYIKPTQEDPTGSVRATKFLKVMADPNAIFPEATIVSQLKDGTKVHELLDKLQLVDTKAAEEQNKHVQSLIDALNGSDPTVTQSLD